MSIELSNGVILPDIPSDVLAQYPYFLITHRVSTTVLSDNYNFFAFNDEKPLCVGVDLSGGSQTILVAYAGTSYKYNSKALKVYSNPDYGTSDTEWSGVTSCTMSRNGFVCFLGSDGVGTTRVVASNFDIYNAATYEGDSSGFGDMTFTPGTEVYFTATHQRATEEDAVTDKNKFLGIAGTERLVSNICSLIDAVLPSGGTTGQVLTIGSDGTPVWADATGGASLPAAEELMFG